jgi:hypothetical protein
MKEFAEYISRDDKVLCLFSSAFGGLNDVRYVHKIGVKECDCVDLVHPSEMNIYGYNLITADVFQFIDQCTKVYDIIIADPFTNKNGLMNLHCLDKLKTLATKYLILGITQNEIEAWEIKDVCLLRNPNLASGIYWRIIKL